MNYDPSKKITLQLFASQDGKVLKNVELPVETDPNELNRLDFCRLYIYPMYTLLMDEFNHEEDKKCLKA